MEFLLLLLLVVWEYVDVEKVDEYMFVQLGMSDDGLDGVYVGSYILIN